jgi:hypothetical protein
MATKDKNSKKSMAKKPAQKTLKEKRQAKQAGGMDSATLLLTVAGTALAFDFTSGFHGAENIRQTMEHLRGMRRILDSGAEDFEPD